MHSITELLRRVASLNFFITKGGGEGEVTREEVPTTQLWLRPEEPGGRRRR